jgi:hypothetical protein
VFEGFRVRTLLNHLNASYLRGGRHQLSHC